MLNTPWLARRALASVIWRKNDEELTAANSRQSLPAMILDALLAWYLAIRPVRERLDAAYGLWQEQQDMPPTRMLFLYSLADKIVPASEVSTFVQIQVSTRPVICSAQ